MSDGVKVASIYAEMGIDIDQVKLNDVVNAIGKLNLNTVLASLGVAGLVDGLKQIMDAGSAMTESMYKFNKITGLDPQKAEQWDEFAQRAGVAKDVVKSSLEEIQKKLTSFHLTGKLDDNMIKGIMILNQYGGAHLTGYENSFDFLSKAAVALQKLSPTLRSTVIDLIPLNEQLLYLKDGFKGANDLPVATGAQTQQIRDYNAAWTAVGQTFQLLETDVASGFAPVLKSLGEGLNNFMVKLHDNAKDAWTAMDALLGIMSLFLGPLGQISYLIYMISTHLKEIKDFFGGDKIGKGYTKIGEKPHFESADYGKFFNNLWNSLGPTIPNQNSGLNNKEQPHTVNQTNTFHIVSDDPQKVADHVQYIIKHELNKSLRLSLPSY